jgi:hypothetical protein
MTRRGHAEAKREKRRGGNAGRAAAAPVGRLRRPGLSAPVELWLSWVRERPHHLKLLLERARPASPVPAFDPHLAAVLLPELQEWDWQSTD